MRSLTFTLEGPRVAEWLLERGHFRPDEGWRLQSLIRKAPFLAPGIVARDVDVDTIGGNGTLTLQIVSQNIDVEDPDRLIIYGLEQINRCLPGLAGSADQLRAEVSDA